MRSPWLLAVASVAIAAAGVSACKNENRPPVSNTVAASPPTVTPSTGDGGAEGGTVGALFATSRPPRAIAVDDTSIFLSFPRGTAPDGGTLDGSIAIAPRGGGEPATLLGGGSPTELLRVGTFLVWIDEGTAVGTGSVNVVELGSGTPHAVLGNLEAPTAIATDGTRVYVSSRGPSLGITIDSAPLAGGLARNLTTTLVGEIAPAGLAIDAQSAYFVGQSRFGGTLFRVPLSGGPSEVLWTPPSGSPGDVLVAGARAFVTLESPGDTSSIVAVPVGGGSPTPLVAGLNHPARLAVADAKLYWTNQDATLGAVLRAAIDVATPDVVVLASRIDSPHAIAVADGVYVTASAPSAKGAVYKLAK
ncbi:MAG: putative serine/threonine-protein kinase pknH [Myxococcaceae bacterium]|nr:putative serine/threonine-protein kinase pknH [Myxococcaceae bacterium]